MEEQRRGLGGILRASKVFETLGKPAGGQEQQGSRLSSKDIVGGVSQFDEKAAEEKQAPVGPSKRGRLFQAYQNYLKEAEEEQVGGSGWCVSELYPQHDDMRNGAHTSIDG
jgi:hypothetical protein